MEGEGGNSSSDTRTEERYCQPACWSSCRNTSKANSSTYPEKMRNARVGEKRTALVEPFRSVMRRFTGDIKAARRSRHWLSVIICRKTVFARLYAGCQLLRDRYMVAGNTGTFSLGERTVFPFCFLYARNISPSRDINPSPYYKDCAKLNISRCHSSVGNISVKGS